MELINNLIPVLLVVKDSEARWARSDNRRAFMSGRLRQLASRSPAVQGEKVSAGQAYDDEGAPAPVAWRDAPRCGLGGGEVADYGFARPKSRLLGDHLPPWNMGIGGERKNLGAALRMAAR